MDILKANEAGVVANMSSYSEACSRFSWKELRKNLLDEGQCQSINIAEVCLDRHARHKDTLSKVAIKWEGKGSSRREITYHELFLSSNRAANALSSIGLKKGDVVATLLKRTPELYEIFFGALKLGCVVAPLFSAFGSDPIKSRLNIGRIKTLVTTSRFFERKILPIINSLDFLESIILIDDLNQQMDLNIPLYDYTKITANQESSFLSPFIDEEDRSLLHFTSGTTGIPKGVIHVHKAVLAHYHSAFVALDIHTHDVYWCTADPGWVTGISYGIIGPMSHGVSFLVDECEFDAERWYELIEKYSVSLLYTSPTAIRMLMRYGLELPRRFNLSSLRFLASVGEPLNPEAIRWGIKAFSKPIHDNWWQTETGAIMIANFVGSDIKLGSMGRPIPGIKASVFDRSSGQCLELTDGSEGELAIKVPWPSMFRGYLGQDDRYHACFQDGWYFTGDLAKSDKDGYFWFIGRKDDVIKTAGHLIGPFEVENILIEHPMVTEAAVIGKPDPLLYEVIKAFVTVSPSFQGTVEELHDEILAFARKRLGAAAAPRELTIVSDLPRTRSGKIMRRLLKAREIGLPEGDLSSLERPESDGEVKGGRL